jgi:hypothetical protein
MKLIRSVIAIPTVPPPLVRLRELAYNLRWAWHHDSIELFRRLDRTLWETVGHNPVLMLGSIDQAKLKASASDEGFLMNEGHSAFLGVEGVCHLMKPHSLSYAEFAGAAPVDSAIAGTLCADPLGCCGVSPPPRSSSASSGPPRPARVAVRSRRSNSDTSRRSWHCFSQRAMSTSGGSRAPMRACSDRPSQRGA